MEDESNESPKKITEKKNLKKLKKIIVTESKGSLFPKRKEQQANATTPPKNHLLKRNPRKRQILNLETAKEDSEHLPNEKAKLGRVINAPETVKVVSKK